MTTISAKAILVSRNVADPNTDRKIATVLCRYPRWIHAEGRTHRLLSVGEDEYDGWEPRTPSLMEDPALSRNASSSRAIPVKRLIEDVLHDPAIPLFWGANQKGMQAGEECNEMVMTHGFSNRAYESREKAWLIAMHNAIEAAKAFDLAGYHKQIVNRLIEPFSHITVVVTATEWDNFFDLRIHKDAEPHICLLATRIKEAIDNAAVQELTPGQWHRPFVNDDDLCRIDDYPGGRGPADIEYIEQQATKLSVARCASTSYKTVDGFDMTMERAIQLYDKLVSSTPIHASPLEHAAQADKPRVLKGTWENREQHRNFVGFRQHRAMI